MTAALELKGRLTDLLPDEQLASGTAAYAIDGLTPEIVAQPASREEVASLLRVANEAGAAVIPWGGGHRQAQGLSPARYDLALDLRRLDRVVEYEPADLTVTVEAGIRLDELQRVLAEHGQCLTIDPPHAPEETIGGLIATNASGPGRIAYGTLRDLLIGVRFVTATGEIVHSGGRVVKNVAGYDLHRLQVGALGTLGVLVEASFKVSPLPVRVLYVEAKSADLGSLLAVARFGRDRGLAINGIVVARAAGGQDWALQIRLAGGSAAVERSRTDLQAFARERGLAAAAGDTLSSPLVTVAPTPAVRARASVIPSETRSLLEALVATAGIVSATWPAEAVTVDELQALRHRCVGAGRGAFVVEAAPVELKRRFDVWGDAGQGASIMRRLKAEFDPNAVLNPGRFAGGL